MNILEKIDKFVNKCRTGYCSSEDVPQAVWNSSSYIRDYYKHRAMNTMLSEYNEYKKIMNKCDTLLRRKYDH